MSPEEADRHIVSIRRTLAAYERMGLPTDDMPMVLEEIRLLNGLVQQHPEKAGQIEALLRRLQALYDTTNPPKETATRPIRVPNTSARL